MQIAAVFPPKEGPIWFTKYMQKAFLEKATFPKEDTPVLGYFPSQTKSSVACPEFPLQIPNL